MQRSPTGNAVQDLPRFRIDRVHLVLVSREPQRVADACHALRFNSGTNPGIADIEKHHRDRFHRHDCLDISAEVLEIGKCMGAPVGHTLGPDARQQVPARKRRIAPFPFLPGRQRDVAANAGASGLLPSRPDGMAEVHRWRPDKATDELCPARSEVASSVRTAWRSSLGCLPRKHRRTPHRQATSGSDLAKNYLALVENAPKHRRSPDSAAKPTIEASNFRRPATAPIPYSGMLGLARMVGRNNIAANPCQQMFTFFKNLEWWAMTGSNRRPPRCKRGALPAELIAPRPRLAPCAVSLRRPSDPCPP